MFLSPAITTAITKLTWPSGVRQRATGTSSIAVAEQSPCVPGAQGTLETFLFRGTMTATARRTWLFGDRRKGIGTFSTPRPIQYQHKAGALRQTNLCLRITTAMAG